MTGFEHEIGHQRGRPDHRTVRRRPSPRVADPSIGLAADEQGRLVDLGESSFWIQIAEQVDLLGDPARITFGDVHDVAVGVGDASVISSRTVITAWCTTVSLSPAGEQVIATLKERPIRVIDDRLPAWPPEHGRQFAELLTKFVDPVRSN